MTSTAASAKAMPLGRKLVRWLLTLALILAILAVALLAAGPLGWRAGWWHYQIGFSYLMPWSAYCGLAAVVVAIVALVAGFRVNATRHIAIGVMAFVVGAAIAYVPWHYSQMRAALPRIHDVTTDWENPPQFHAILPLREAAGAYSATYEGAAVSDLQRKAYPDIVPLMIEVPPGVAFTRALKTAQQMGWTIIATDPAAGRIEATQTTRWFGFTDDVVIRIAAADRGSRIDIRSVSRITRGRDYGANAARVRGYLAALRDASKS